MPRDLGPGFQIHPLEQIVNVQWGANDFVITGFVGANLSSLQRFLIYSKNGIKWTKLPTIQLPPNNAGLFVYGSGAWLALAGDTIRRSIDKFATWETVPDFPDDFPGVDYACYGKPKKEVEDPPLDENGDPIRRGVFVAIGEGVTNISICSSLDRGDTWTVNKTISKSMFNFSPRFVTFVNGKFFACVSGRDQNNGGHGSTLGPAAPGQCKLYTSEDGVTWDDGSTILSSLNSLMWGSELGVSDPSTFFVEVFPKGLVSTKEKAIEGEEEPAAQYVISGFLGFGGGNNLWYAKSSSTSFGGATNLGSQSLFLSPLGQHFTPATPGNPAIDLNGGTVGEYYLTGNTNYTGGNIAAVGNKAIVAAQKYSYTESTVTHESLTGVPPVVTLITTDGYLVVSSDQEGVLSPSENYFCGGTFTRESSRGTDGHGDPILITEVLSEAAPAVVAANGRKQPDAPEDSPGTFLWVRNFAFDTFNPETEVPISNRGMEVNISPDGEDFTVVSTPIKGTVTSINIALGATPKPPEEEE